MTEKNPSIYVEKKVDSILSWLINPKQNTSDYSSSFSE